MQRRLATTPGGICGEPTLSVQIGLRVRGLAQHGLEGGLHLLNRASRCFGKFVTIGYPEVIAD